VARQSERRYKKDRTEGELIEKLKRTDTTFSCVTMAFIKTTVDTNDCFIKGA
jgi:hypothetical protein